MNNLIDVSTIDEKEFNLINIINLLKKDLNDINQIRTNFLGWMDRDGKKFLKKLSDDNFNDLQVFLHKILFFFGSTR